MRFDCVRALKLTLAFLSPSLLHGADFEIQETAIGLPTTDFHSVFSLDGNRIWASADPVETWSGSADEGKKPSVYMSVNGGDSWTRHLAINGPTLEHIHFVDSQRGFAITRSFIVRTTDGGTNWQTTTFSSAGEPVDIFFLGEDHIWAVWDNEAYRSTNGGDSWTPIPKVSNGSLFFLNKDVGFMGDAGSLIKTSDGETIGVT